MERLHKKIGPVPPALPPKLQIEKKTKFFYHPKVKRVNGCAG